MQIRYPDYYKRFRCIAGECPDTCCAGWEIAVDPASEKRYRNLRKQGKIRNREFEKKLERYVKGGRILSEGATCPFLDCNGLCEMYRELGEDSLCHTCAHHPRHLEDYGNLHEMVLLLSCPEVARLVLEENGDGFYVRDLPEKQGNMDGIDEELLGLLLQVRELIWEINRKHELLIDHRMAFILALAHDIQRRLQEHDWTGIEQILKRYGKPEATVRFFVQWHGTAAERNALMTDFVRKFEKMDVICKDWPEMMKRIPVKQERRYVQGQVHWDFERVFSYFIYSFFLGALYDEDVLTKVKMAVMCTMLIEELYAAEEKPISLEDRANICHALARQIENSDDNRAVLETMLRCKTFSARRIIHALL